MHHILKALKMLPKSIIPKTFKELEVYPDRDERNDDSEYRHAHHQLVEVEKHPCFWCGKTKEEVLAEGNTLETHHWAEQSLWNKFDQALVYKDLKLLDFHGHAKDLPENPCDLHANHIANLVVSCSACHRENGYGLHGATIPFVWARRWLIDQSDDVLQRWKPMHVHIKTAVKKLMKKKGG
ncbi:hypothetical protein HPT25_16430 [Bacillus sp. BRMEA1]|uniref:hypothetical protein n=1 Tax=Neobacillus endophyticus TaxID=2738405 RepID=UPI0015679CCD|nr:hypothetical protein [Neobacillus endophyticus]NRD78952.1 hypothetical protein [Neobacillus endophyticus]